MRYGPRDRTTHRERVGMANNSRNDDGAMTPPDSTKGDTQQTAPSIEEVSRAMSAISDFEQAGAYERDDDAAESDALDETDGKPKDKPKGRLPVVLGIALVAFLIVAVTSLGLQWMARHGGGKGDPVEASSEVDNTPIPLPHVTEIGMVNMSFPADMGVQVASGDQWMAWDGQTMSGTMQTEVANQSNGTVTLIVPTQAAEDLIVSFSSQGSQRFLSFSSSMVTKENGLLMMTGSIHNLPHAGTARIIPIRCHVGITNTDPEMTDLPIINTTVSYTVGDGNADYVGSYVSCSTSLTLGAETTEAYLTTGTREVRTYAPNGFGGGDILQAGRTTIRRNGMQESTTGIVTLKRNKKEISKTYEEIEERDESERLAMEQAQASRDDAGDDGKADASEGNKDGE